MFCPLIFQSYESCNDLTEQNSNFLIVIFLNIDNQNNINLKKIKALV